LYIILPKKTISSLYILIKTRKYCISSGNNCIGNVLKSMKDLSTQISSRRVVLRRGVNHFSLKMCAVSISYIRQGKKIWDYGE
jgi:hypothetical protein